jgi:hypothetical protein
VSGSEDYDQIAMPGGYMICVLMTKLPGEQLDYYKFWKAPIEEREEDRKAFKTALTYVRRTAHWSAKLTHEYKELWKRRIDPEDMAMRNLHVGQRRRELVLIILFLARALLLTLPYCYIADFEDYKVVHAKDVEEKWASSDWLSWWGLSEEHKPDTRYWS